jgi:TetR/AcrR family transcriptional regulator, transcriptional repressor for nem operon
VRTRRIAILDAAARLINEQGFSHTSVEDLITAAGLSGKSHFYHYFKSKEELGYEVLERQFSRFTDRGLVMLREPVIEPIDRLTLFIDTMVALQRERGARHGSPFGNLAGELADSHEGFRRRLDAVFNEWAAALCDLLDEMRAQLREDVDTARMALFIMAALEGGMLLTRVKRSHAVMVGIGQDLKQFIATQLREPELMTRRAAE